MIRYLNMYRDQAREFGYEASGDQLGWAAPIYVADTDERAREEAKAGVETLFNDYLANPWEMLLPPGYMSMASLKRTIAMRKHLGTRGRMTIDELAGSGTVIVGSPKTRDRADREGARGDRRQPAGHDAAVRRAAERSDAAQHGTVRRRGDAEAAQLSGSHLLQQRAYPIGQHFGRGTSRQAAPTALRTGAKNSRRMSCAARRLAEQISLIFGAAGRPYDLQLLQRLDAFGGR